jgi:hypothetical protein
MRDALKPELPILTLVGRTSAIARGAIGAGLPADADDREIVCFATFSPATFPVERATGHRDQTKRGIMIKQNGAS